MRLRSVLVEAAAATAGGLLLTVVVFWSVVRQLGSAVPGDVGDPLLQAWQLAWGAHGLLTQPLQVFEANTFAPLPRSLAFSDSLLGYAPAGLIGSGTHAALVRYDVMFLLAHALAFAGMYVLIRQLGMGRAAAVMAGAAFAFSPFRLSQATHLQSLSSGGIPLALAMLARGHAVKPVRRDGVERPSARPWWALAGWLTAAWQLTLGFGLGLQFAYLLAALAGGGALLTAVRRVLPPRRLLLASGLGLVVFLGVGTVMAAPYQRTVVEHPESRRDVSQVDFFSPPLRGLITAPPESRLWGGLTEPLREGMSWRFEQSLAPGLAITVLAVLGLVWGPLPRRYRAGLVGGILLLVTLSLGTHGPGGGRAGFLLLFDHFPGWQGVRTPSRLVTLAWLVLGVLGALGAQRLVRLLGRPSRVAIVTALLTAAIAAEGLNTVPLATPRPPPAGLQLAALPQPVLVLPSAEFEDNTVMLWSTDGFPAVVNGASGFRPAGLESLRAAMQDFPSPRAVLELRIYGVRSVVLLRDQLAGTPLEGAIDRATGTEIGVHLVTDTRDDEAVVFLIDP